MNTNIIRTLVNEVIDTYGNLIGVNDAPDTGENLESACNGTTDSNASIGHQNYRNSYASIMGFRVLEKKDNDGEIIEEDKLTDKKDDDKSINNETSDNDVLEKKIKDLAGLLNKKFNKDQLNRLVNLLEIK